MRLRAPLACLAAVVGAFGAELPAQRSNPGLHTEESARAYLQNRLRRSRTSFPDTRYALAWADLNGDGRNEAIIRIMSGGYCGNGGCNLYVLSPWGRRWSLVGRMTITKLPVRVLNSRSHGWRDLSVRQSDCCDAYDALLPFDGRIYPFNPSMPPARRLRRAVPGRVLISADTPSRPLF